MVATYIHTYWDTICLKEYVQEPAIFLWEHLILDSYPSVDFGNAWTSQLALPSSRACYALTFVNKNLGWAGTQGGSIFKYVDITTGLNSTNNNITSAYALHRIIQIHSILLSNFFFTTQSKQC